MKKTIFIIPILFSNFCFSQTISPNIVNVSGSSLSNGSNILTFNIGELAVTKVSSSTNSITQGFLQPEDYNSSILENNLNLSYYPNPTNNILTIEGLPINNDFRIELSDMLGRTLFNSNFIENQISLEHLEVGNYQLKIYNKSDELISSQLIIKTNK